MHLQNESVNLLLHWLKGSFSFTKSVAQKCLQPQQWLCFPWLPWAVWYK